MEKHLNNNTLKYYAQLVLFILQMYKYTQGFTL